MLLWQLKPFTELSALELYNILRLRGEVFVLEQNCPYVDADGKDISSYHLCGFFEEDLAAYARIVPPGIIYAEPSIGRVVTSAKYRRIGLGKELVRKAIEETKKLYGETPIRIGAQAYLKKFYETLGFKDMNEPYVEDGIPHLIMLLK
jgi:ElaA protein